MGVHPFGDPSIRDEFAAEEVAIDAREPHTYSVRWTSTDVAFYVDDRLVKVVDQSPAYPMQFMLDIYEFSDGPGLPSPDRSLPKGLRGRVVQRLPAGRRTGCAPAGVPPLIHGVGQTINDRCRRPDGGH